MSGFFSVEQKREIEFYENHEKETGGKNNMCVNFIIAYWWYMYKYVKKISLNTNVLSYAQYLHFETMKNEKQYTVSNMFCCICEFRIHYKG